MLSSSVVSSGKVMVAVVTTILLVVIQKCGFTRLFLDPRGGSLSLTHVVVLHLLLVDFFVSQPTVFIETS